MVIKTDLHSKFHFCQSISQSNWSVFWGNVKVHEDRVQLKRNGTRWRTGGEVKGKLPNGMGSQYPSHHLWKMVYPTLLPLMRTPRLSVVDWTNAPADLNGLVRFAERQNLVSACVPHFKSSLPHYTITHTPPVFPTVIVQPHCMTSFDTVWRRHLCWQWKFAWW